MRLLLDENMPTLFSADFGPEHEVHTVRGMGWLGKKNGELLTLLVTHGFDALITVDKNLYKQQNPEVVTSTVILLRVFNNRLDTLQVMLPKILEVLNHPLTPGIIELRQNA